MEYYNLVHNSVKYDNLYLLNNIDYKHLEQMVLACAFKLGKHKLILDICKDRSNILLNDCHQIVWLFFKDVNKAPLQYGKDDFIYYCTLISIENEHWKLLELLCSLNKTAFKIAISKCFFYLCSYAPLHLIKYYYKLLDSNYIRFTSIECKKKDNDFYKTLLWLYKRFNKKKIMLEIKDLPTLECAKWVFKMNLQINNDYRYFSYSILLCDNDKIGDVDYEKLVRYIVQKSTKRLHDELICVALDTCNIPILNALIKLGFYDNIKQEVDEFFDTSIYKKKIWLHENDIVEMDYYYLNFILQNITEEDYDNTFVINYIKKYFCNNTRIEINDNIDKYIRYLLKNHIININNIPFSLAIKSDFLKWFIENNYDSDNFLITILYRLSYHENQHKYIIYIIETYLQKYGIKKTKNFIKEMMPYYIITRNIKIFRYIVKNYILIFYNLSNNWLSVMLNKSLNNGTNIGISLIMMDFIYRNYKDYYLNNYYNISYTPYYNILLQNNDLSKIGIYSDLIKPLNSLDGGWIKVFSYYKTGDCYKRIEYFYNIYYYIYDSDDNRVYFTSTYNKKHIKINNPIRYINKCIHDIKEINLKHNKIKFAPNNLAFRYLESQYNPESKNDEMEIYNIFSCSAKDYMK